MNFLSVLILLSSYLQFALNTPSPCLTPNSEKAHCVSLFSCSILQAALGSGDETAKKFVAASKCGDDFMVCCGTVGNFTSLVSKEPEQKPINEFLEASKKNKTRRAYVLRKFLPTLQYCGFQHSDDHYNEGNDTAIDEFPWLVHIDYRSPYLHPTPGTEFKCAGVLISEELVLTSFACAGNYVTNIKIGQYNKHNSSSCVTTSLFGTECSDPVIVTFGARQEVPDSSLILIRLTKPVQFSDYIRPICLPFEELQRPKVGDTVYTSGWGEEDVTGSTVHIKKKVAHQIKSYKNRNRADEIRFGKNSSSRDVCEGDQGGPLMYPYKHQWFLTGLVTNTPCNATKSAVANGLTSKTMDNLMDPIFNFLPRF